MRRLTNIPKVTAGLMWQPEIGPTANAMASRESPKAKATPTLPTFPPAITAVVNPANTRTNVPNNSAAYFMRLSPHGDCCHGHVRSAPWQGMTVFTADRSTKYLFEMSAGILHGKSCFRTYLCWCSFLSKWEIKPGSTQRFNGG